MHLLQSGVDIATIALWLGHESIETTQGYVEADLTSKQTAFEKLAPAQGQIQRFQPDDDPMRFLAGLYYSACNHHESHISSAIASPTRNNAGLGITIHRQREPCVFHRWCAVELPRPNAHS
jgi:hypothetical protein